MGVGFLPLLVALAHGDAAAGDVVVVRDEGGGLFDAAVTAVEVVRLGRKYRLRIGGAHGT